ncbi:MAG: GNAT family N-acetyltransferase [Candidatus Schekmanbacteria bacterium]|nr:GNAT family N-acetyltransferase [Candidatus Schekmanbacteria bacterium]
MSVANVDIPPILAAEQVRAAFVANRSSPPGGLVAERIGSRLAFLRLYHDWHDLLENSKSRELFLTWEWMSAWWQHLSEGRCMRLIALWRREELVALAPLMRKRWPFSPLELLGTGSVGSDYLDIIVRDGCEEEVLEALAKHVTVRRRALVLGQLAAGESFARRLAARLVGRGWHQSATTTNVCPIVRLEQPTFEDYIASLGPRHRQNFRARCRKLQQRYAVSFALAGTDQERREALEDLLVLHFKRWQERGGSDAFHTRSLRDFHEELSREALERGWLRLFLMRLDGRPAAAVYGFRFGHRFLYYQAGFDPALADRGVGLVMAGLVIRHCMEEGVTEFDFLHGEEPYKYLWAGERRTLECLRLYPPGMSGRLRRSAGELKRRARRMARKLLDRALARRQREGRP